jgi:hypothetical protein
MKIIKMLATSIAFMAIAVTAFAQEEDEAPERYTYATYYNCGGGPLSVADEIIAEDYDRLDALVDDGTIAHWGWLAHHTGGQWQRIFYYQADGLDALFDAGDAVQGNDDDGDDDDAADDDDRPPFGSICNRHDDYIWQVENGASNDDRGEVGFSVYHACNLNNEERADEIVAEHVAPILNKMVEDGDLTSWGWQSHVIGGRFRKLQTMTAVDTKSLVAARTAAIAALYDDDNEAGEEFTAICGPHVDYIWNIVHEK